MVCRRVFLDESVVLEGIVEKVGDAVLHYLLLSFGAIKLEIPEFTKVCKVHAVVEEVVIEENAPLLLHLLHFEQQLLVKFERGTDHLPEVAPDNYKPI